MKKNLTGVWEEVSLSFLSVALSLLVGAIIISVLGYSPIAAYGALLRGAMGSPVAFTAMIKKAVPLILSGLAVAVGFRCSAFNIGVEGQLMVGALCAALAGIYLSLPPVIHLVVVLLAGIVGGMLFAFVPALLKLKCNVNVTISTIILNYVAQFFVQFCVMGPFHGYSAMEATDKLAPSAQMPSLLPKPYQLNLGVVIMILTVFFVYYLFNKTVQGYEMTAVGLNQTASQFQGISVDKMAFLALLISGGIAGLSGSIEVSGTLNRYVNGFSTGYGFSGIPIALMAQNNPFAIILTGLFFGLMKSGSFMMQSTVGVSADLVNIIQGLVVVFLCFENFFRYYLAKWKVQHV
ncbi:MAG: ABC transporter permease [Sphaerochaetaceae bacterium]|nr:ABC transporter permease [Spirochaetales bacterium]MDY5500580.1 ABC transporter permease [Sphaerochaetaceae bacterium]